MALSLEDEPVTASPPVGGPAAQRALTIGLLLIITLVAFEALAVATVLPIVEDELGELRLLWMGVQRLLAGQPAGHRLGGRTI
jgi:hypothetical protein